MSILAAIRGSMKPPVPDEDDDQPAPSANHAGLSGEGETSMTDQEHQAALATARAEGKAEGVKEGASAERTRIGAIVAVEGIAGNAGLIGAAVAMAGDFPDASAETIAKHTKAAAGAGGASKPHGAASPASLAERLKAEQAQGGDGSLPNVANDQPVSGASRLSANMKTLIGKKD